MPRNPIKKCDSSWEDRYGTTASGNLPRYKITECVESVVDLPAVWSGGATWVRYTDFHYYHLKCPYSTESDLHYVRNIDRNDPNFWEYETLNSGSLAAHTATNAMMIRYVRGSKYGWLCVDPNCPYFVSTGMRYFQR